MIIFFVNNCWFFEKIDGEKNGHNFDRMFANKLRVGRREMIWGNARFLPILRFLRCPTVMKNYCRVILDDGVVLQRTGGAEIRTLRNPMNILFLVEREIMFI